MIKLKEYITTVHFDPSIQRPAGVTRDEREVRCPADATQDKRQKNQANKSALAPSDFAKQNCIEGLKYRNFLLQIYFISSFTLFSAAQASEIQEPIELIKEIKVTRTSIEVVPHQFKDSFYRFDFKMELEDETIDLSSLPQSIVNIPFILCSIPFIWGSKKTFIIDEIDEDLAQSIERLNLVFKIFYPTHPWSGTLKARRIIKNNLQQLDDDHYAILFSHGLDSVSASFEHIDKKQLLITICGNDVGLGDKETWNQVKHDCTSFAKTYGHSNAFLRSNCRFFMHTKKMTEWCKRIYNPWSSAMSSFCLAGLAAPLLALKGHKHLFMGSTRTSDFPHPLGSHPLLDNNISFCGISLHHAQPEYDRVEKIKVITEQAENKKIPCPFIRVCFTDQKHSKGNNCGQCHRCLRTIMEIVAAQKEPQHFGFAADSLEKMEPFFSLFKGPKLTGGEVWHWMCVQKSIQNHLENLHERYKDNREILDFIEWLLSAHLPHRSKNNLEDLKKQKSFFYDLWQLGKMGKTDLVTLEEIENKIPKRKR